MARIVEHREDYKLVGDGSAWIEYKNMSIYLRPGDGTLVIEVFRRGAEMAPPLESIEVNNPRRASRIGM